MNDRPVAPPAAVVIGVDVGTTAAKVSAFEFGEAAPGARRWRHTVAHEYPLLQPQPGWHTQQPAAVSAAVLTALGDVVAACKGAHVVGISVSTAMHALMGLDAHHRPVTALVTWADSRSVATVRKLRSRAIDLNAYARTGTPLHPMLPLAKIAWFTEHQAQAAAQVHTWVGLKEWLMLELTGTLATDVSCASGTGLMEHATLDWAPDLAELAGTTPDRLAPILPATSVLGLRKSVAGRVGLPTATPVVIGAADGPLGNVGTGALAPGFAGLSIGTSGAVRTVVQQPVSDSRERLFCYALLPDLWVTGGAISNGGSVLRWAAEVFGGGLTNTNGGHLDDELLDLAAKVAPGSDGLLMIPYLMAERAPLWDPDIAGAFLGLRRHHSRAHFVRAAVEGVAFQIAAVVDALTEHGPVDQVRSTGGVFRHPLWCSVVGSVLGMPLTVTDGADGTALGAAALGLYALERAADLPTAVASLDDVSESAETSPSVDADVIAQYATTRQSIADQVTHLADVAALHDQPLDR